MHNYADEGIDMGKALAVILSLSFLIPAVADAKPRKYSRKYLRKYFYTYRYKYKRRYRRHYRYYRKAPYKINIGAPSDKIKLEEMIKELF